jgi:hypothetical protein
MIGEYLRLTEAELDRAIRDPAWALAYADAVSDAIDLDDELIDEDEAAVWDGVDAAFARSRRFRTDKAWDSIGYLLRRAGCPVEVTAGENDFTTDDWGYGPARYLTARRVRVAADFLRDTPFTTLVAGVVPADLDGADVSPLGWDPKALAWVGTVHEGLVAFFATAANDGDAMLVWLS